MSLLKEKNNDISFLYKTFSPFVAILPSRIKLHLLYLIKINKILNLSSPETFNEKIQYRKLFDRNPLYTILADKIESKKFIENKKLDIYIPKILWQGESFYDLDISQLPDKYVIKANHASKTNIFIKNGKHLSIKNLEKLKKRWFSHDQSSVFEEWAYKHIPKKVFIEEFLDFNNTVPDDYKFFVYHGKVRYIQYDTGRFKEHRRNMFDKDWNDLNFNYSYERLIPSPKKPNFIEKMIQYAEIIGKDIDFIRVDFYYYKNMITFGELTIYPGAGFEKFPTYEWDLEFGKFWNLK